jgi:hypothetical protein
MSSREAAWPMIIIGGALIVVSGELLSLPWWWVVLGVGAFFVWLGIVMLVSKEW